MLISKGCTEGTEGHQIRGQILSTKTTCQYMSQWQTPGTYSVSPSMFFFLVQCTGRNKTHFWKEQDMCYKMISCLSQAHTK